MIIIQQVDRRGTLNRNIFKRFFTIFIVFQLFLSVFNSYDVYAGDKTAPLINCTVHKDVSSGKIKLKMSVTDNKSIKSVKYAFGNHRKTFFRDAFYYKKIKNVSVTSTKNISTTLTVKQNAIYTIYAIDKTGNSTIKRVKIKVSTSSNSQTDTNINKDTNANTNANTDTNTNTNVNTKYKHKYQYRK